MIDFDTPFADPAADLADPTSGTDPNALGNPFAPAPSAAAAFPFGGGSASSFNATDPNGLDSPFTQVPSPAAFPFGGGGGDTNAQAPDFDHPDLSHLSFAGALARGVQQHQDANDGALPSGQALQDIGNRAMLDAYGTTDRSAIPAPAANPVPTGNAMTDSFASLGRSVYDLLMPTATAAGPAGSGAASPSTQDAPAQQTDGTASSGQDRTASGGVLSNLGQSLANLGHAASDAIIPSAYADEVKPDQKPLMPAVGTDQVAASDGAGSGAAQGQNKTAESGAMQESATAAPAPSIANSAKAASTEIPSTANQDQPSSPPPIEPPQASPQHSPIPAPGKKPWETQSNNDFRNAIAEAEQSAGKPSDGYGQVNAKTHALGRYQLLRGTLEDAGWKNHDGTWTSKANAQGVHSDQEFLNNSSAQEVAFGDVMRRNEQQLKANGASGFIGQTVTGPDGKTVTITAAGLAAAAHRQGAGETRDVLDMLKGNSPLSDYDDNDKTVIHRLRTFEKTPYGPAVH